MRPFLLVLGLVAGALGDCWWTGCQLDSWAVRGCGQYNMDEAAREGCPGGMKYKCCDKGTAPPSPPGPGPAPGPGGAMPSWDEFRNAVTFNSYPAPTQDQYNNFVKHAARWGRISTKEETAMALAQFLHESDGLRAKREYACQNTQCPNDYRSPGCDAPGQYYYGRGYIQLSWCQWNYKPASYDIFGDDRLVRDPDQVARDESTAWATAFWFWGKNVHDKAGVQQGQFGASTNAINGALECGANPPNPTGRQKRFQLYGNVRRAFGLAGSGSNAGC